MSAERPAAYMIHRCRSCKVQVQWEQRDRLSYGWYHGYPGEGCKYGQYLNPEHVEQVEVVPKTEQGSAAKVPLRCRIFGHDDRIIPDPRPRDYGLHGRPILRPSPVQCVRCGSVSYER